MQEPALPPGGIRIAEVVMHWAFWLQYTVPPSLQPVAVVLAVHWGRIVPVIPPSPMGLTGKFPA
jgi:hypothetical protein